MQYRIAILIYSIDILQYRYVSQITNNNYYLSPVQLLPLLLECHFTSCYQFLSIINTITLVMHMSRKRKVSLRTRAMEMNEARAERKRLETETSSNDLLDDSPDNLPDDLPAPADQNSSDEEMDEDFVCSVGCSVGEDEISTTYSDWISEMQRSDKQKIAMMVYDNYISRFKTGAAKELGFLFGISDTTVRFWRKDFLTNDGDFSEDGRGSYDRYFIVTDERYHDMALEWIEDMLQLQESQI